MCLCVFILEDIKLLCRIWIKKYYKIQQNKLYIKPIVFGWKEFIVKALAIEFMVYLRLMGQQ